MISTPSSDLLDVLVIDDEQPALDELVYLLERDPRVATVRGCDSAAEALRLLQESGVDAVFLDVQMPGLTGLDLAQVLSRFKESPPVVFVTAYEKHAVDAFELRAVDYVLKPVRAERLGEAVRRVVYAALTRARRDLLYTRANRPQGDRSQEAAFDRQMTRRGQDGIEQRGHRVANASGWLDRGRYSLGVHRRALDVGRGGADEDHSRDQERQRRQAERERRRDAEGVIGGGADVSVGGREQRRGPVNAR